MTRGTPTVGAVGVRRMCVEIFCIDRLPSTGFYYNFSTDCLIIVTRLAYSICIDVFPVNYCDFL